MTYEPHPEFSESEAALIERRQDQGVWNGAMGAAAIEGAFSQEERATGSGKPPKPSRRRPQPLETSGETMSRDIANRFARENPAPANQSEINARGRELLRQVEKGLK
jgi:hypothetical protein